MTQPAPAAPARATDTTERWRRVLASHDDPGQATAPRPSEPARDPCAAVARLNGANRATWVASLAAAGVAADRVSCPDLLGQLGSANAVDAVLLNVLDSDPAYRFQTILAGDFPSELLTGLAAVARVVGARQAITVLDADAPADLAAALRPSCRSLDVQLVRLTNPYPQAHPTLLLHAVLGRKLRPRRLPTDVNAVVLDAPAAIAVGRFVLTGAAMRDVPAVVHDARAPRTTYVTAPVGARVGDLLAAVGVTGDVHVRAGDLLRDTPARPDDRLGAGELSLQVTAAVPAPTADPCIRCGWCLDVCPTRIHPAGLLDAAQRADPALAARYGADACVQCGLCTYVCPSRLPLLAAIRTLGAAR